MKSLSRPLAITCCEAPFFFRVHDTAVKHVSTQFSRSLTTVHGSILIYMHFGMFARVFTTSMSLQCSISTPAALRHPQKKQPLELWNMYLVHLVDFCYPEVGVPNQHACSVSATSEKSVALHILPNLFRWQLPC